MLISSRQSEILKLAGIKEKKRATGINFDAARKQISQNDIGGDQNIGFIQHVQLISDTTLLELESTNLNDEFRKILNQDEAFFVICGLVFNNKTSEANDVFPLMKDLLISKRMVKPGDLQKSEYMVGVNLSDIDSIKSLFAKLLKAVQDQELLNRSSANSVSGEDYISNDIKFEFGDGWKVVYLPAFNEKDMPIFPGKPNSSYDRTLEGNKNGLCLGSQQNLYQDNNSGKIFSVRNPENEPEVTIRISNNELQEAKGKNNLSPSVDGAKHAKIWFESDKNRDLNYLNNHDYKKFPPTTIEFARSAFAQDNNSCLTGGWVSSWFGNGILELDNYVKTLVEQRDIQIVYSGMGKKYKELIQPVVEYWCEEFVRNDDLSLFGGDKIDRTKLEHESWKTYRKLQIMKNAIEKLSKLKPDTFLTIGAGLIPEFAQYLNIAAKQSIKNNPKYFLQMFLGKYPQFSQEPELIVAAKNYAEKHPDYFLWEFADKYPAYADIAAKNLAEKDPSSFLESFADKYPAYADIAAKNYAEKEPHYFLRNFADKYPAYNDIAAKDYAEKEPYYFLADLADKYPAYADIAAKNLAEKHPDYFLADLADKYPAYADIAAKNLAEQYPSSFLWDFAKTYPKYADLARRLLANASSAHNNRLIKLSKALSMLGLDLGRLNDDF